MNCFFQQIQSISGNHLRPYTLFVGYLATKADCKPESIKDAEYNEMSRLSMCVELIHKSSLILDDLIDGDSARHGKSAFYIEYGAKNTMMFAINLLSISVQKINQFISENETYIVLREKGLPRLSKTMYDMSLGELKELNLDDTNHYNYKKIKEIIELETSPLISNSLLFGYYAGNGDNNEVAEILRDIGNECGLIFQIMNDLEAFCQQEKLVQHKGRLNTDASYGRKNIAMAFLWDLIPRKDRKRLNSGHYAEDEANDLLIYYFKRFKVRDSFMREINSMHEDINIKINELHELEINSNWCSLFQYFISEIIQECKNRLV